MTRYYWIFLWMAIVLELPAQVTSEPTEGLRKNTPRVHVLRGARVIPAPGKVIEDGTIVLRDGLIEAVGGAELAVPADARVWDVSGKTVYAGFIEPWKEIKVEDAEGDQVARHWNEKVRPERLASRALGGVAAEEVKALRALGFTAAQLVPSDGIFGGSSCVIALRDGASGDRILNKRGAQSLAFEHGFGKGYPSSLMGSIAMMRQTLYDARWQRDSMAAYAENPKGVERVEANESLDALRALIDGKQRGVFRTRDELSYARFLKVADEFQLTAGFLGCGYEYRVAAGIQRSAAAVVVPLNFPSLPPVEDLDAALEISLAELEHWEFAPSNAGYLVKMGVPISLTTAKLGDVKGQFWENVRVAVKRGLSVDAALAGLTTEPARLVGMAGKLGTIAEGKMANLVIADGELFTDEKALVDAVWIDGNYFEQEPAKKIEVAGRYSVEIGGVAGKQVWEISGEAGSMKIKFGEESFPAKLTEGRLLLAFPSAKSLGKQLEGVARLSAQVEDARVLSGAGVFPGGEPFQWKAVWEGEVAKDEDEEKAEEKPEDPVMISPRFPAGAFGFEKRPMQVKSMVVRGATIWTCGDAGILEGADLWIEGGKIKAVGTDLKVPAGTEEVNAPGAHVTPGLIDCHSHIAISRGVNEGTHAVTVEVRIGDVLDPTDIGIYRQLAGGLTSSNLMHGSANPMGGQNQVIKLRWGSDAEGLKFEGAKPGVKFALGENVKQSNWGADRNSRYPQTRMGVQQIMRDTFMAASEYGKKPVKRRDLRMEAALEILKGERIVHIHSYRQDEILMFVRLAEELGFTVGTFQHVLEGYKVADEMAKLGAGGSTFSDWWAYKMEVYDAIPYNGALMREVGVLTSFNSDDAELATRMNLEAAKAVKYGGVPEAEALKFVTLNPARQLQIDDRVGSLEVGKDADFVIWSEHPMLGSAVAEQTWIDGRLYYSVEADLAELERINVERERLIAKVLPLRVKALGKDEDQKDEAAGWKDEKKPGLRFLFPSRGVEEACGSIYLGLYHNGRSLHTCSRTGCCNE